MRQRRLLAAVVATTLLLLSVPLTAALATTSPKPADNPDLAASCGTDVTIVIDRSGSIGANSTTVQQAAQTFVDALVGTGSQVQVVAFSTRATAEPGGSASIADLAFHDPASLTIPTFTSSGSTNWDDALEMVRRSPAGHAPLTVVITDGDPTRHNEAQLDGHGGTLAGDGSTSSQADLDAAVSEANAIKALPSHLFVVGVGSGVTNAASQARIRAISGPDELTFSGPTPSTSFGTADYTVVGQFAALKTTVARFVRELCGPSLNVVKELQLVNGSTVAASAADGPFGFTAALSPTPAAWTAPAQPVASTATLATTDGVANFAWDPATADAATTVILSEAARAGWVPNGQRCWLNNLDGTPAALVVDDVGANTTGSSRPASRVLPAVGPYQAMNCEVFNRQVRPASVSVDKVTVPGGRAETFGFDLRTGGTTVHSIAGVADATAPTTFGPVAPGTYDVVEAGVAHFSQTSATCDDLATQTHETKAVTGLVVAEGSTWQCTFTNTLHDGSIRVVKALDGAPSGTFDFSSSIPGHPSFQLAPTAAADAAVTYAAPAGTYSVAEAGHAPFALSASCDHGSDPGHVVVVPDAQTTCTFTNTAPAPTITVTKAASVPSVAEPGADVTFTVTVTNASIEPLTLSALTDTVAGPAVDVFSLPPSATTCLPLHGSTVAAGATVSCTFVVHVAANAGQTVTDTVKATATDGDGNDATDHADASVRVTDVAPTLVVSKTTLTPAVPEPGGPVSFAVSVTNTSQELVTLTSLVDRIAGGAPLDLGSLSAAITQTTCSLLPLAPGATALCSFTAPVTGDAGDVVNDVVTAVGVDDDGSTVTAHDAAEVTLTDVLPHITVTKVAGVASVPEPGGPVTFTVGVHNDTAEAITLGPITDAVGGDAATPAGGSCAALVGTALAGGASTICTFTRPVVGDASDGPVSDTVTVTAHDDDDHETTGAADATVKVDDVLPTVTLTKTAEPSAVDEPGGPATFTLVMANTSVEPVTIDALVDRVDGGAPLDIATLPGTCEERIGHTIAAGASSSCTFQLAVAGNGGTTVHDVVTLSAGDDDGNQATATASADVAVRNVLPAISVTKAAGAATTPEPGSVVTYTVTVANHSVEAVTVTSLTDAIGDGDAFDVTAVAGTTCTLPHVLAVGGSYQCTFPAAVSGNADDEVTDVVVAAARDDDGSSASATDTASVGVTDVAPTITVAKTTSTPSLKAPGGAATFEVTITNTSPETVTVSAIVDTIDGVATDVTKVAGAVTATTCATGIELAAAGHAGAVSTCSFTLALTGAEAATITDVVTVTGHDDEGNDTTASDDASTDVVGSADLAITKAATVVPTVGQTGTYTLAVTDLGPSTAHDVVVVDELPPLLLATSATGDGWTCTIAADKTSVSCARPTLAPGPPSTITIKVSVGDPGEGVAVTNTATVSSPTPDPDLTNNSDSVTVIPSRLLDASQVLETPLPLPKTGGNIRGLSAAADALLILGVALLLADAKRKGEA